MSTGQAYKFGIPYAQVLVLVFILFLGCSKNYRPSIIDIREEPTVIDWSPRQPERFADIIRSFKP